MKYVGTQMAGITMARFEIETDSGKLVMPKMDWRIFEHSSDDARKKDGQLTVTNVKGMKNIETC